MRNYGLFTLAILVTLALISGCGGGGGTGSMMLRITDPPANASCPGNRTVTATMLNPAMATTVEFRVNGKLFETFTTPALTMSGQLDTLSLDLANGPATIVVQSTGNVYTASVTVNINNPTSLYVQDISGDEGSYVTVHVKLNDFAGAAGYHVILDYDDNKLQLNATTVAMGAGVPGSASFTKNQAGGGVVDVTVTGNAAFTSGDIMVADFQIKTPSPHGTHNNIDMRTATLTDTSGNPITVAGVGGRITTN